MLRLCFWMLAALACVLPGAELEATSRDLRPGALLAAVALAAWALVRARRSRPAPRAPGRPPHAVPLAAELRRRDLSRTLAYLESLRDWPRPGRRGEDR